MKSYDVESFMVILNSSIDEEIIKSVSRNNGDNHYLFIKGIFKARDKIVTLFERLEKEKHFNLQREPITNKDAVYVHSILSSYMPSSNTNDRFYVSGYQYVYNLYSDKIELYKRSKMKYYIKSPSEEERELSEESFTELSHIVDKIYSKDKVYVLYDTEFIRRRVPLQEED